MNQIWQKKISEFPTASGVSTRIVLLTVPEAYLLSVLYEQLFINFTNTTNSDQNFSQKVFQLDEL